MTHKIDLAKLCFAELCARINSPYALKATLLLRSGDKEFLTQLVVPRALDYVSTTAFADDYSVYSYLRKYVGLDAGVNKKEVALSKWHTAEEQCRVWNKTFDTPSLLDDDVECAINRARRKIARVLGPFQIGKALRGAAMGPGASYDIRRSAEPGSKLHLPLSVTPSCLPYARAWLDNDIHWAFAGSGRIAEGSYCILDSQFTVVRGNKMITVPKDASVDRVICIEPTFNLFLQKGVGSYMRHRLKAFCIDLDDQSRNQDLAHNAFEKGYATLDLSSASDTICSSLIKTLLPLDWWLFLDDIRSKSTRLPCGDWHSNAKWSSMGNGFTFELETLIFWSLSPDRELTSVYGDDIVCTQEHAPAYIRILEGVGFTVNVAKSHVHDSFYESCGKHFFEGHDVTPCFQKEVISSALSFVRAHNRLFRMRVRHHGLFSITAESYVCLSLRNYYPYKVLPYILHTADDRGFLAVHRSSWKTDLNRGIKCSILKISPFIRRTKQDGLYVTKLQSPSSDFMLTPSGGQHMSDERSKVRLTSAWVQPFNLTNKWLPHVEVHGGTA